MGARCTFVFKQKEDLAVALYSHWGEYEMHRDLALALQHAAVRKGDLEYYTRMAVSHLLKESILDETGFGLYACNPNTALDYMDSPILIDLTNNTISDETGSHEIDSFINYHLPSDVHVVGASEARVGVTLR